MQSEVRRDAISRYGMVGQLLDAALGSLAEASPSVLDCGGGSGSFAVPLARSGALVTVLDISADALATLRRRAAEAQVGERVHAVQGDVEALSVSVAASAFDLVLAHGILEAVDSVAGAFAQMAGAIRPGGLLSVLVSNPAAGVLARALAGDLVGASRELQALDQPQRTPGPDSVHELCAQHGLAVEQVHGIGVFADLVPGAALDAPGAREALAGLEAACATRSPFAEVAGRVHVLARRPVS